MTQIRLTTAAGMTPEEWQAWSAMQLADPALASPYFRPEFTQGVASVRRDVEIAVLEEAGEPIGFFPFQRNRLNLGKPVGGKLSDYHGLIGSWGTITSASELIEACGLSAWDFDHLLATPPFENHVREAAPSRWIDLSAGYEAYAAERRAAGTEILKKTEQQTRKLERGHGELRFEAHTTSPEVMQQLREWKSAQYRSTGLADLFTYPWIVQLLEHFLANPRPHFSLELSALWCGDELLAAMLSLRSRNVVHSWFPAYSPAWQQYAPGLILFNLLAKTCQDRGFSLIDLGKGEERYKLSLSTPGPLLATGSIERPSLAILLRRGWRATRDLWQTSLHQNSPAKRDGWLQPLRNWLAHG